MLLECGGGLNKPAPSRSPQNTVNFFFDFLQVHNELGKVIKFGNLQTLFFMEKWTFEKSAGWFCPPPRPNRVNPNSIIKRALNQPSQICIKLISIENLPKIWPNADSQRFLNFAFEDIYHLWRDIYFLFFDTSRLKYPWRTCHVSADRKFIKCWVQETQLFR